MNVYLVEDQGNAPGRIYAVFVHREDAELFSDALPYMDRAAVIERTLFNGQPPIRGYNA